jgi:hypothetical protein
MSTRFYTTSVRFSAAQTAWLTAVKIKILAFQGKHIDRSALLRGMLDGLAAAHLDLSDCKTEEEIKRAIVRRLGTNGGKRSHA